MSSTCTTGAFGELLVCADLLSRGFQVFRNVSPVGLHDLVVEIAGDLYSVQVKTTLSTPSISAFERSQIGAWVRVDDGNSIQYSSKDEFVCAALRCRTEREKNEKPESHVSPDGKWRSFPRIKYLMQYVSSRIFFVRVRCDDGKTRRVSLETQSMNEAMFKLPDKVKELRRSGRSVAVQTTVVDTKEAYVEW